MNTEDIIFNNEEEAWEYFYENYPNDFGWSDRSFATFKTLWWDSTEKLDDGRILLRGTI